MSTMLQLVQQATGEMGLTVPTAVAGSTSADPIQQLALLNALGYQLIRKYQWEALCTEYSFTTAFLASNGTTTNTSAVITGISSTATLAASLWQVTGIGIPNNAYIQSVDSGTQVTLNQAATQSGTNPLTFGKTKYALPSDYDRQIDRTHWDKSKHWEMLGPETAQQWQWLKSGYISTGPRVRYRILGGYFQVWPVLGTAELLGFEYVSKNWAFSSLGTAQASFTADSDTCIFPDRLMVAGLKNLYYLAKGLGDTYTMAYEDELTAAKPADGGSQTLSFAPRFADVLITSANIPDSGYGQR